MLSLALSQKKHLSKALVVGLATVFFIACAQCKIYLPISPVPITLHTFALLLIGTLLPFRQSIICIALYLVEGFVGSPFLGAPMCFTGVCMGYYIGWAVALYFLSRVKNRQYLLLSLVTATSLILFLGWLHLQFIFGPKQAWMIGVAPFIIGDALKAMSVYALLKGFQKKFA